MFSHPCPLKWNSSVSGHGIHSGHRSSQLLKAILRVKSSTRGWPMLITWYCNYTIWMAIGLENGYTANGGKVREELNKQFHAYLHHFTFLCSTFWEDGCGCVHQGKGTETVHVLISCPCKKMLERQNLKIGGTPLRLEELIVHQIPLDPEVRDQPSRLLERHDLPAEPWVQRRKVMLRMVTKAELLARG